MKRLFAFGFGAGSITSYDYDGDYDVDQERLTGFGGYIPRRFAPPPSKGDEEAPSPLASEGARSITIKIKMTITGWGWSGRPIDGGYDDDYGLGLEWSTD